MKKNKIISVIAVLLIISGIALAILPSFSNQTLKNNSETVIKELDEISHETLKDNQDNEGEFNFSAITSISPTTTLINSPNYNKNQIIGQLVMPELDINLTIFNTLNDGNLLAGVTTMKTQQVMGQGNYAIAGHYTSSKGVLFSELVNAKVGQTIRLTDKETIFVYEVVDVQKVNNTDIHMIYDQRAESYGGHIISLMSCYYYDTDYRWFVTGTLVETIPYTKEVMNLDNI